MVDSPPAHSLSVTKFEAEVSCTEINSNKYDAKGVRISKQLSFPAFRVQS